MDRVRETVLFSLGRSAGWNTSELGLSKSTIKCILHKDLRFHPYKLMVVEELNAGDYQQHLTFTQTMLNV